MQSECSLCFRLECGLRLPLGVWFAFAGWSVVCVSAWGVVYVCRLECGLCLPVGVWFAFRLVEAH
ncbi:hypothetical protein [Methanimicrococcus hongohii]|uniref:hypothetical protein n=1 Tax=Methanimicrococcus hongohii TaxID=3028295 RepID=UPI002931F5BA|nr:hypothetical protein [Methanimicrococcus sp. Hf6]